MKKVGIVTWYWGNYGSILQAYALQQAVVELGFDAEVIQHRVTGRKGIQIKYRLMHQGFIPTVRYYSNRIRAKFASDKDRREIETRYCAFEQFLRENLVFSVEKYGNSDYQNCQGYDYYICGSDQIWNPNTTFFSPFYWLGFVKAGKKIAYAPSMGSSAVNVAEIRRMKEYLETFAAISVREKKTEDVLKETIGVDVTTVCDPTMLLDADIWRKKLPTRSVPDDYLFAYLIRGSKEQREYITQVAKRHGLKLVVYPYMEKNAIKSDEKDWGDIRCFQDSPFDFLEKISNANMVITDSFHCTVFSTLFHKDFYVLRKTKDTTNQFARMDQLLGICDQKSRILSVHNSFEHVDTDFQKSDKAISQFSRMSMEFLKNALDV